MEPAEWSFNEIVLPGSFFVPASSFLQNSKKFRKEVSFSASTLGFIGGLFMDTWNYDDIPYDAMGDYSAFHFSSRGEEDNTCSDQDSRIVSVEDRRPHLTLTALALQAIR